MKQLFIILLVFIKVGVKAQTKETAFGYQALKTVNNAQNAVVVGYAAPCPEIKKIETYTQWSNKDTIGNHYQLFDTTNWVYADNEVMISNNYTYTVYCPCGCHFDDQYEQLRINKVNGIRQHRIRIITYQEIPKPKTKYEQTIEDLQK